MGRPRKEPGGTSSPRPAAAASKAAPAAPPPSASATKATAAATGSRSRSAPAAGPSRGRGAKTNSSQPRPAASHRARGDARDQHRASTGTCSTAQKVPDAKGAAGAAPRQGPTSHGSIRADPRPQKKPLGADLSGAEGQFLPPLESQDIPWVEQETRGQRSNPKWYQWRENRITASVAPRIANSKFANGKTDEVPQSYLRAVVSSGPSVQTPAMSWGIRNEKAALQAYEQLKSQAVGKAVQVDDCGLFIHREKKWIAASPDGIIKEAATGKALGLVEVKCPYKHRNRTVREACKDKDFCLEVDGDAYALKKDHPYFTQVQCQLAAAGFQQADFVVHTTKETAVVPVEFDAKFWGQTVPKLEKFYTEAVIPHLEAKAGGSAWAKEE
ncbi:protein capicua homolog [Rissa tridactyla]|uniref:protein capicua homolog n=1 Tax=Rissa tridactyla TaxID=75485 RepID=UPI0023BA7F00|nr:protein capicua homolog [Rissa tridactyla]XP_054061964.1 protein capicua homolog [Rissa tridactyla]XP_054061966.1 protein capicua homolog [Rissa tridactyla]